MVIHFESVLLYNSYFELYNQHSIELYNLYIVVYNPHSKVYQLHYFKVYNLQFDLHFEVSILHWTV